MATLSVNQASANRIASQMERMYRPADHRPIVVASVLPSLRRGGTEGAASQLSVRLRQRGYEPVMIALSGGSWEEYLAQNSVPAVICGCDSYSSAFLLQAPAVIWSLTRVFRRLKPDIVNGFLYPLSIWSSLAAWLAGVPIAIANRRDCGFQRTEAPLPRWLEVLSYRATTKFVANSLAVVESLRGHEGIGRSQIEVIYNGITLPDINPIQRSTIRQRLGFSESTLVVGMVANFWSHKNHLLLVDAAKQVVARVPQVMFVLAGGYDAYQQQVESEITRQGLRANFRIIGQLGSPAELLPAVDVCVLCSQSEGFSNAILEYMAYGKPVIATRVGGNPEAVVDGKTGYLVDPDDSAGLANALLELIRDPFKRDQMGRLGRARVESEFSWDRALERWDQLFQSCTRTTKLETA